MIKRDSQFYTFVVTRSKQHRIQIRRIEISKSWLQSVACVAIVSFGFISYSFYNAILQTNNTELARQQQQLELQSEAKRNREQLTQLWSRIQSVEQDARRLAPPAVAAGEGGPEEAEMTDTFNGPTSDALYAKIRTLEATLRDRASIPSIFPLIGKINNEFGWRANPFGGGGMENHPGMDIDGNKGDVVISPAEGVVVKTGWQGGYGNMIEISHGNDLTTRYGHLSQIGVEIGQAVTRGQEIGRVGSTGRSTGPHLHYEVRQNDQPVDPRGYLPPEPAILNQ